MNQTEDSRKGKEKETRGGNYWQLGNQQYGDLRAEWEELVDWKCLLGPTWSLPHWQVKKGTVLDAYSAEGALK